MVFAKKRFSKKQYLKFKSLNKQFGSSAEIETIYGEFE